MGKKNVLIVESGGKVDTIKKILGSDWDVAACGGHVRDMPQSGAGFNHETLEIEYELTEKGKRSLSKLKAVTSDATRIVLAMDPDREGEAIADDLRICMNLKENTYERVTFNAITKDVILDALNKTRGIDYELVMAQKFRRMIDRVVGWDSTKAVQIKTGLWKVVGRVQTPALALVVERDLEIENFKSQTHYGVKLKTKDDWTCSLNTKESGLENEFGYWLNKDKAEELSKKIKNVKVINSKQTESKSPPPNAFKTTTMQIAGINKLKIKGKEVMELASALYEEGLITYIRTDDERMADEGYESLSTYVKKSRQDLTLSKVKRDPKGKKAANMQEAHECVRPTDFNVEKISVNGKITQKHVDLYRMIFDRALASQLDDAIISGVKLTLEADHEGVKYIFMASSSDVSYLGWRKVTEKDDSIEEGDDSEETDGKVPLLDKGKLVAIDSGSLLTKKTSPPPNYTEPKLIIDMERLGIGRPSTYQSIVSKLNKEGHGYLKTTSKNKREILVSTKGGRDLIKSIEGTLGDGVLNIVYTQEMEDNLDKVSGGCENPKEIMFDFMRRLAEENQMLTGNPTYKCEMPDCNGSLMQGRSKKTKKLFWRCIVRDCKNIVNDEGDIPGVSFEVKRAKDIKDYSNDDGSPKFPCPNCESAIIKVEGKYGDFWPCSKTNDPDCNYKTKDDGGKPMSDERAKELDLEKEKRELEAITLSTGKDGKTPLWECSNCKGMVVKRPTKKGGWWFKCSSKECSTRYWSDNNGEPKLSEPIKD